MKRLGTFLIIAVITGLSYGGVLATWSQATAPPADAERFPIVTRFELPRDYGYFIGDEIPLTLIVEATQGMILDLVNLPKQGEKHGVFEIRHMRLSSATDALGGKVYRATYILQYFGATPLTAVFEPLDILYADAENRPATTKAHSYKSLRTQPVGLSMARIGPYGATQAREIKGPVTDSRQGLIWGSLSVGCLFVFGALVAGGRQWYETRKNRHCRVVGDRSLAETTLDILQLEGAALRPKPDAALPGVERLQHIIRQYIQQAFTITTTTLTTAELGVYLGDSPLGKELLNLLEQCDTAKYEAPLGSTFDTRHLWWEAITAFEKLQQTDVS